MWPKFGLFNNWYLSSMLQPKYLFSQLSVAWCLYPKSLSKKTFENEIGFKSAEVLILLVLDFWDKTPKSSHNYEIDI